MEIYLKIEVDFEKTAMLREADIFPSCQTGQKYERVYCATVS